MIKKSFIYLSTLLTVFCTQMRADEGIHSNGHLIPVILNAGEHLLTGKSRDGKIQLENGLILKVLSSDEQKVSDDWEYHEHLSISPNPYPGGGSEYYVLNINRGEFAHANLYSPPNPDIEHTKSIFHIDPFDGEVIVKTREEVEYSWKVEQKDLAIINEWKEGDRIVIGMNSNWFASYLSDCKYIMINCDQGPGAKYVRIKPY